MKYQHQKYMFIVFFFIQAIFSCLKIFGELVKSFNQTKIKTFAIGIRSISGSKTIETHASLFLSEVEASKFIKYNSDENYGIII